MPKNLDEDTRILVVDDDVRVRRMLQRYFEGEGYQVSCAADGREMKSRLETQSFDIVLLDLVLPGGQDGLDLAREIRSNSDIPIMMLTGRDEVVDRIVGLEIGADDYVTKPFHLREVHARLKSILRRRPDRSKAELASADVLIFEGWRLDKGRRQLINPQGAEIELSTGEFDMLDAFVSHAGRVLTRETLMGLTRRREREPFDRTIDAQIVRLRRKIEADPRRPQLIKSVRGIGYVFTARPASAANPVDT
jgi:DNA-binding response OmpR family regulator